MICAPASLHDLPKGTSRLRALARRFSADYWRLFAAAFCMDFGFSLFFFLFNIYLRDLNFNEGFIGQVMACLTIGNIVGTLPATILARRRGLRPLLIVTFLLAPVLCAARALIVWPLAQPALAFATGAALCGWPICLSPAIAALTNTENRASGFSIAFATGIGLGSFAGIAGGYVPEFLHSSILHYSIVAGIRIVLLLSCVIALLGVFPLLHLSIAHHPAAPAERRRLFHPYLWRFLPAFMLWNVATGSFPLFGSVFLQQGLGISLGKLGSVFSSSQLVQFGAVLLAPLVFRRIGIPGGVAAAQVGTALFLVLIASTRYAPFAVCFYLLYFGAQFMCSPGIYNLLMNNVPEEERSQASAVQNLAGALCQAGTAALTGACIVAYGYHIVLFADAAIAISASLLFFILGRRIQQPFALRRILCSEVQICKCSDR